MRSGSATPSSTAFDRSLGVGDKLLQISVVGLLRIADDGKRSVVDDGVAASSNSRYS
jgi:hypothetical protein